MLEFSMLREIVKAYEEGKLKEGDLYKHNGKELSLVSVNGRTVNARSSSTAVFKGSEASGKIYEMLSSLVRDLQN